MYKEDSFSNPVNIMKPSDRQIILVPFQNTIFKPQLDVQNPNFGIQLSPDLDSQTYISQNKSN
jgi:hypothetical protein